MAMMDNVTRAIGQLVGVTRMKDEDFFVQSAAWCFESGLVAEEYDSFMKAFERVRKEPPGEKWRKLTLVLSAQVLRTGGDLHQAMGATFCAGQAYEIIKREAEVDHERRRP